MNLIHLVLEFLIFPVITEPVPITHFNLLPDYQHQNVKIKLPTKFKEILVLDYMPSINCSAILSAYYVEMASQLTVDLSPLLQVDLVNTTLFTEHNHSFYTSKIKPF
jgi:hypothetical protein